MDPKKERFRVNIYFEHPKGIRHYLGTWEGLAVNRHAAEMEAVNKYWDTRLYAASCSPYFDVAVIQEG